MRIKTVVISGREYRVFVANGFFARLLGLSWRKEVQCDGMLFVFPFRRRWPMWMLGMKFGLDVLFLDDVGRVVDAKLGITRPRKILDHLRTFRPNLAVRRVLELQLK